MTGQQLLTPVDTSCCTSLHNTVVCHTHRYMASQYTRPQSSAACVHLPPTGTRWCMKSVLQHRSATQHSMMREGENVMDGLYNTSVGQFKESMQYHIPAVPDAQCADPSQQLTGERRKASLPARQLAARQA